MYTPTLLSDQLRTGPSEAPSGRPRTELHGIPTTRKHPPGNLLRTLIEAILHPNHAYFASCC